MSNLALRRPWHPAAMFTLFRSRSAAVPIALVAISALGLALRLFCLDCQGLWFDEIASVEVAQRGLPAIFTDRFGWMYTQTPLYYLIVWLTLQPVDPTTTAALVRLPSALAGALSVPVTYLLGRELFGRAQGLLGALFLALSAVHLNYSLDARPYSLMLLATALSVYCLLVAERTASGKWWAAFAAATIAGVLLSYHFLAVALPAYAPYVLWMLWKLWRLRSTARKPLLSAVVALLAIAPAVALTLFDLAQVPRTSPNLSLFAPATVILAPVELASYFTRFGLPTQLQQVVSLLCLLIALFGAYLTSRAGRGRAVFLCALFIIVPSLVLAVLSTTNVVYQRYALFAMPFYFLLVANGVISLASLWPKRAQDTAGSRSQLLAPVLGALLALPFAFSTLVYFNPDHGGTMLASEVPDMRRITRYLTENVREGDMVIFVGWDPTVSLFYWKGDPPVPVFSVMDPLIFRQPARGSIYWVFTYELPLPPQVERDPRWTSAARFTSHAPAVVLRQEAQEESVRSTLELVIASLEAAYPNTRSVEHIVANLRGCIYQANADALSAANSYYAAGTFFPIGGEYLRTSRGFAAHGELDKAWRDALISKSMQPYDPDLHRWLAELLSRTGHPTESAIESQIATNLDR